MKLAIFKAGLIGSAVLALFALVVSSQPVHEGRYWGDLKAMHLEVVAADNPDEIARFSDATGTNYFSILTSNAAPAVTDGTNFYVGISTNVNLGVGLGQLIIRKGLIIGVRASGLPPPF